MKKALIFGAGVHGHILANDILSGAFEKEGAAAKYNVYSKVDHANFSLVGFIDNNTQNKKTTKVGQVDVNVYTVSSIDSIPFDIIFLANASAKTRFEMLIKLLEIGVTKEKIYYSLDDMLSRHIFKEARNDFLKKFGEMNPEIDGDAVECGVNTGYFAERINKAFPSKTLHLFDTFKGFDAADLAVEAKVDKGFNIELFGNAFFDSWGSDVDKNIERVVKRCPFPQNLKFYAGRVPETFEDEALKGGSFAFVNLDMDLYAPTLSALQFFVPRMVRGGAILLHDYFSENFMNIKKAVEDYQKETGAALFKAPIGDLCSLLLLF
jgi:hypothetical protein